MRLMAAVAIATLAAPASVHAKEYGKAGTIELGGSFSAGTSTVELEDDAGDKTKTTNSGLSIGPDVGFFLLPGIELIGALRLGYEIEDDDTVTDTTSSLGLGVGGGILLPVGRARIGPQMLLTYTSQTQTSKDTSDDTETEVTFVGPGVRLQGVAKLPIGEGGIITAGLYMEYFELEIGGDADDTQTHTEFGTAVGFSVYF